MCASDPMLLAAREAQELLDRDQPGDWAEIFVRLKLEFFRNHARGCVSSITHGTDYFRHVIQAIEGTLAWKEPGEYGDNFRRMIVGRLRE